ncbi:hypothetical protein GSH05_15480 [Burkholderia pseudomallei]|nr:hypothetical protein [Burkholderia pseudomallei]
MTLLCRRAVDVPRGLAVQSRCDALIEASRRIGRNGARPFAERPGMGGGGIFRVHRGIPGNAARILRKKYCSSRYP